MGRFNIGQQVTVRDAKDEDWTTIEGTGSFSGEYPKRGKIYTVSGYDVPLNGVDFIYLNELHPEDSFDERAFEPLVSDSVLGAELESVPEPYTL